MGKFILIVIAALAFSACGKVPEDQKFGAQYKITTPTSGCDGKTPAGLTVFNKTWRTDWSSDDGNQIVDIMTVESGAVSIKRTCIYGSAQASITVRTNAAITSDLIQILSNDDQSLTIKVGDKEQTCSHSLHSGKLINYSFRGTCLQAISGGTTELMIPAN